MNSLYVDNQATFFCISLASSVTTVKTSKLLSRGKYEMKTSDTVFPENYPELF